MNIDDLATLMGKSRKELEEMLNQNNVIELELTERNKREEVDIGKIEVLG